MDSSPEKKWGSLKINRRPDANGDLDTILRRADAGDMAKKPKRLPRDVNSRAVSRVAGQVHRDPSGNFE
jgi:hypothetical protein